MNTIRTLAAAAAISGLVLGTWSASASDSATTQGVAQPVVVETGGSSTDATDRGGRPAPKAEAPTELSILDWLRGLMD